MREFRFELRVCAALEDREEGMVARQLGGGVHHPGNRILDVVVVEPGPSFEHRVALAATEIPPPAIDCRIGPGRARPWPPDADWHPETATRIREEAEAAGFFESERRGGRRYVRQTTRYPRDWFGAITAIENKPDLARPGTLSAQLRHDVSLRMVDQVVLATRSHVTGAHLNRLPPAVGVWRIHGDRDPTIEVIREPTKLSADEWGIEILERDRTQAAVRTVSPAAKADARLRIAERAYGKGWRPSSFPGCEHAEAWSVAGTSVPGCEWYDRIVDPGECGAACPGYCAASPPPVDAAAERARRTAWNPTARGPATSQGRLTEFSESTGQSS